MILWKTGYDTVRDYDTKTSTPAPRYAGAVLGTTGRDVRVMSDVWSWMTYAQVWDGTKVKDVAVASSDPYAVYADVTVDATPAVLAAVTAFKAAEAAAAAKAAAVAAVDKRVAEATRVAKGKDVTVVKGRKVPLGTTGRVFWLGETKYGTRVGLALADGTSVFTAVGNVAVSQPDEYLDVDGLMAMAA